MSVAACIIKKERLVWYSYREFHAEQKWLPWIFKVPTRSKSLFVAHWMAVNFLMLPNDRFTSTVQLNVRHRDWITVSKMGENSVYCSSDALSRLLRRFLRRFVIFQKLLYICFLLFRIFRWDRLAFNSYRKMRNFTILFLFNQDKRLFCQYCVGVI